MSILDHFSMMLKCCYQMQALHDVVQAGYTRYIGMSSCWAWQCEYHPLLLL